MSNVNWANEAMIALGWRMNGEPGRLLLNLISYTDGDRDRPNALLKFIQSGALLGANMESAQLVSGKRAGLRGWVLVDSYMTPETPVLGYVFDDRSPVWVVGSTLSDWRVDY
jgi:hypothetical protein